MKKLLCTFLVLLLMLSLIACNAGSGAETSGTNPSNTSSSVSSTSETSNDDETKWYLSEPLKNEIILPEVSNELANVWLKIPSVHEESVDGMVFKVEFFEEYYKLGSLIQVRITVTNNTAQDFLYRSNSELLGYFQCEGKYIHPFFASISDPISNAQYDAGAILTADFPSGEVFVFERLFIIDPAYFGSAENCVFQFKLTEVSESGSYLSDCLVTIPVEIIEGATE